MKLKPSLFWSLSLAFLIAGFISGWVIKTKTTPHLSSSVILIHDTLKSTAITYKTIPGKNLNIDSLITVTNTFWKDSLKTLYGKGLFEAKFQNETKIAKQEFTLESRIPIDPEANLVIDEQFIPPPIYLKRTFGIVAGLTASPCKSITVSLGAKYYILDFKHFSLTATAGYTFYRTYYINVKSEISF